MTKKRLYPDDPDWTYKTIVLPKGRVFYNKYYYKRKRAYRIVLDTPKATQLAGYILIEKDLRYKLIHSIPCVLENISSSYYDCV